MTIVLSTILTPILFYFISYAFVIWFDTSFGFETIMDQAAIGGITYDILLVAIFLMTPFLITWTLTKIINKKAVNN